MKKPEWKKMNVISGLKTKNFRLGGYSVAVTMIVLAIAVVINVLAGALPGNWMQFDTTSGQLFAISEQTQKVARGVETDINIYWIVQSGQEDSTIQTLLQRYADLNHRIRVIKKDPDVYPTFAQQYTSDAISNNCLIVEANGRSRYISNEEIYVYDFTDYYTNGTYDVSFDGEAALTSAIIYVTNEELPKLYTLTGHGELALSSSYQEAVEKENMEVAELSLLTLEAVPEDADCILIHSPSADIAPEEKDMLAAYLQKGGNLFLLINPPEEGKQFPYLEELMKDYGITTQPGIVVEGSQSNYAFGRSHYLLPNLQTHAITQPLQDAGYYVLLPIAQGLTVSASLRDTLSVTELLTTSVSSYSKIAGYSLTTYEKEEGDIDGPFALAIAATEAVDSETTARFVCVSSGALADDTCNSKVSGANLDFFLNTLGWMCEREESISIHAKAMDYTYLTIDNGTASALSVLLIGVLPVCYLAVGVYVWIRRKRR